MNKQIVKANSKDKSEIMNLQRWLNELGYKLADDGIFGLNTTKAVANYEMRLKVINSMQSVKDLVSETIITHSKLCLDMEEISGNLGFKNKWYYTLMNAVGFNKGEAWCCYAVELIYKLAYCNINTKVGDYIDISPKANKDNIVFNKLDKLFSGSTQRTFTNFATSKDFIVLPYEYISSDNLSYKPMQGSIVIFQQSNKPSLGHAGILENNSNAPTFISLYEGNTSKAGSREGTTFLEKIRNPFNETGLVVRGYIQPIYLG